MAYSKIGYFALKKETTQGTSVQPDVYIEMLDETIKSAKPIVPSAPVYGNISKHLHANRGMADGPAGDIKFEIEPNSFGYILDMFATASSSGPTDTTAYTHVFSFPHTNDPNTYTIDIAMGGDNFVKRYVGCVGTGFNIEVVDNVLVGSLSIQAESEFIVATVSATVSSGTTLTLSQTTGITTDDTLILSPMVSTETEEVTVTSVDSETQLTVSTISSTHTAGDVITIKKGTASFSQLSKFTWIGNTVYKEASAIGSVACVSMEQFSTELVRDVEVIHGTSCTANQEIAYYPTTVLTKGFESSCTVQKYWEDEEQQKVYQQGEQYAIETESTNNDLAGAASVYGLLKIQLPNVRNNEDVSPNVGQDDILQEARTLQTYYDSSAAYQTKITLINKIASY